MIKGEWEERNVGLGFKGFGYHPLAIVVLGSGYENDDKILH
jgi:hypothetical protein